MSNISQYLKEGKSIPHTPVAAVYAGNIINLGSVCGFAPRDIGASALGTIAVTGVIRAPFVGGIVANIGDNVWWDANGTPYGGAATGAMTVDATAGDWWVGTLTAATSATGTTCDIALNQENLDLPAWPEKTHIDISTNDTLAAADHSGSVVHITADGIEVTLPGGVVGMEYIVQNDMADGDSIIKIIPDGTEELEGANITLAAADTINLTKDTGIRGDFLHLEAVVQAAAMAWKVTAKRGIWEALTDR